MLPNSREQPHGSTLPGKFCLGYSLLLVSISAKIDFISLLITFLTKSLNSVYRYPSLTVCEDLPSGCAMDWHFWGTGHGKGPHDGAGACLKQSIRKEQLRRDSRKLHGAADVVNYLKTSMNRPNGAYPAAKRVVDRHFTLIGKTEVCRKLSMGCATINGSRSMHSIRSVGPQNNTLLQVRDFSCFCSFCLYSEGVSCCSAAFVKPWKVVTLVPTSSIEAMQEEDLDQEWEVEDDSHDLAMSLEIGDHFAILADPEDPHSKGAEFFVLLCTKKMYVVEDEILTDAWGGVVERTDEVVEGLYYEQHGLKPNSYVLLDAAGPARVYSHLVFASKFSMKLAMHKQKSNTSVYKLSDAALSKIARVLRDRERVAALESDAEVHSDEDETESDSDEDSD